MQFCADGNCDYVLNEHCQLSSHDRLALCPSHRTEWPVAASLSLDALKEIDVYLYWSAFEKSAHDVALERRPHN